MLVPYDPSWPQQFEVAASELRAFGNPSWEIEHIGSTAIPGMSAKPIIDLAVRFDDHLDLTRHGATLEERGWAAGSGVRSHPVLIKGVNGRRTHIAHFFHADGWDEVSQRLFRDWLVAHPDDARKYDEVKRRAAEAAIEGLAPYNAGKSEFVQEIVDNARRERELPSIPVSDK